MKKKILLPTDFSKNSWNAVTYALKLYADDECDFYLLNAFNATGYLIESMMIPEPGEPKYEDAKLKSEQGLSKLMDMIKFRDDENPKHNFYTISNYNNPLGAIEHIVEKKDIEMIVMGTKGETSSNKVFFGSHAIDVMEKIRNCPVLVIPENVVFKPLKEIVFPTSYKTHFKRRELIHLIDLTKKFNASIRILHISEEDELDKNQEERRKMLEEYFEGFSFSFHTLTNIKVQTAINCFVESRNSDLVAFINKKHAFFGSLITKPLVKSIGYQSDVPILVMHDLRN
ncbi:universal stress protein [Urechidicola croceus]|uniref:Universal stress protein n=1 Tax=Urechidicola croceus TaxID=1850246 RepID=A0A1D8P7Y2_9FLAO|nr:universal stress protein [Urechidicola croceus]AOW20669.1 universal stress protein [Urechidicola croceus]